MISIKRVRYLLSVDWVETFPLVIEDSATDDNCEAVLEWDKDTGFYGVIIRARSE